MSENEIAKEIDEKVRKLIDVVNDYKARAEAAEATLERVRSITVEEIHGLVFRNKTDESDDEIWIEAREFHKLAESIHHLLTERMEGTN